MSRRDGIGEYGAGAKRAWRRWVLNQLLERQAVPKSEVRLYYLAAADGWDRQVGLRKGLRDRNMVGVSRDAGVVRSIRAAGGIAVRGELADVLRASATFPPTAILADYCCGLHAVDVADLVDGLFVAVAASGCRRLSVAVNLQRGRDDVTTAGELRYRRRRLADVSVPRNFGPNDPKHRGGMFVVTFLGFYWAMVNASEDDFERIADQMSPSFNSYRAARVRMDTVVFSWGSGVIPLGIDRQTARDISREFVGSVERRLIAARAVHTRARA